MDDTNEGNIESASPSHQTDAGDSSCTSTVHFPENLPDTFGLKKYQLPELLCRQPPAVAGKDDDIVKLKEILDEILLKLGKYTISPETDKVLFGPNNKILAIICSNFKKHQISSLHS